MMILSRIKAAEKIMKKYGGVQTVNAYELIYLISQIRQ